MISTRELRTEIILGDCREILKNIRDNSIDLILTSPPYTDRRKNTYGGIAPKQCDANCHVKITKTFA